MKFGPNTADGSYLTVYGPGYATGNFRAPIFYDSDNTAYYVDPASTSRLNNINFNVLTGVNGAGVTVIAVCILIALREEDAIGRIGIDRLRWEGACVN